MAELWICQGAARFTHNSHLRIKQGWTENERKILLLVLVLRVGMQPRPPEGRTVSTTREHTNRHHAFNVSFQGSTH